MIQIKKTSKNLGIREILVTFVEITDLMYVNGQKRKLLIFLGAILKSQIQIRSSLTIAFQNMTMSIIDEKNGEITSRLQADRIP